MYHGDGHGDISALLCTVNIFHSILCMVTELVNVDVIILSSVLLCHTVNPLLLKGWQWRLGESVEGINHGSPAPTEDMLPKALREPPP